VSASPRIVTADVFLAWEGTTVYVRKGTMASVPPGSALETAYGGSGNLRVLTAGELCDPESSDRSFQAN
jgi:hypothetical protein